MAVLGLLVFAGYRESVLAGPLAGVCALTARAAHLLLGSLGVPVALDGTTLSHPGGFACEVYFRCSGILPVAGLAFAIWASPGTARRRIAGIALGTPLLLMLNLTRIAHVFVVGATRPELFDLVHGVAWEAATVAAVIGCWGVWLRVSGYPARSSTSSIVMNWCEAIDTRQYPAK